MRLVRSAAGILVGFGIFYGGVRMLPASGLVVNVTLTILAALVSGYATALIAGAHEFPHVAAVGMMMVGMGVVSMRQEGAAQPGWHQISIAGCGPISAMIGAAIRLLTKPRQGAKTSSSEAPVPR